MSRFKSNYMGRYNSRVGLLVPKAGIEPARSEELWILSFITQLSIKDG